MARKNYSQTSRDRLAFNFLITIPVLATLFLIHHFQDSNGDKLRP